MTEDELPPPADDTATATTVDPAAMATSARARRHAMGLAALSLTFDWLKSFSLALLLFVMVRAMLVEAFKIPSGSMERTLLVGDFLLVNKLVYGAEVPLLHARLPALRQPANGDVVVFTWPADHTKNFVKRIVGVGGDTLEMSNGELLRNGDPIHEPYAEHLQYGYDPAAEEFRWQRDFLVREARAAQRGYHPSRSNWGPLVVPAQHYFVLGDNRDNSLDSRYWGFLPDTLVRGQPLFVYYSFAPDTAQTFDWVTRVRWDRIGTRVE
jgi:signal peptidase I